MAWPLAAERLFMGVMMHGRTKSSEQKDRIFQTQGELMGLTVWENPFHLEMEQVWVRFVDRQIEVQFLRGLSVIAKILHLKALSWSITSSMLHMMPRDLFSSAKCISLEYLAQQTHKQILRCNGKFSLVSYGVRSSWLSYSWYFQLKAGWVLVGLDVLCSCKGPKGSELMRSGVPRSVASWWHNVYHPRGSTNTWWAESNVEKVLSQSSQEGYDISIPSGQCQVLYGTNWQLCLLVFPVEFGRHFSTVQVNDSLFTLCEWSCLQQQEWTVGGCTHLILLARSAKGWRPDPVKQ